MTQLKLIIAGGRDFMDLKRVMQAMNKLFNEGGELSHVTHLEIVSGGARGADRMGELLALENNLKLTVFPADWDRYGKRAGYMRNQQMAQYADALLAFWDGESKGTQHMVNIMQAIPKPTYIERY